MPHPERTRNQKILLKQLGNKFKTIREKKNMSLEDVAKAIQKDRQSIHRLEKGETNPTFLYLTEVCNALEVDFSEIIKGIKAEKSS